LDNPILSRDMPCELRADEDGDGLTLTGYAAVFNTPTRIDSWEGTFDELIDRGAFKKTISERMPILQWNHGQDPAVGQVPIGAIMKLREDARGLYVEARLHDNDHVRPIRDAIASGAVQGMSFRFQVIRDKWDNDSKVPVRTIKEVRLFEVGPVAFPAYEATSVGVRDAELATTPPQAATEAPDDGAGAATPEPATEATRGNQHRLRIAAIAATVTKR
jgi:uncharacterized protein